MKIVLLILFVVIFPLTANAFTIKNTPFERKWDHQETQILSFDCMKNDRCRDFVHVLAGSDVHIVNKVVNNYLHYKPEVGDHWDSLDDIFSKRIGDCEEFVFVKTAILIALGFDPDKIKIHFMQIGKQYHLSLSYDDEFLDFQNLENFKDLFYMKLNQDGIQIVNQKVASNGHQ